MLRRSLIVINFIFKPLYLSLYSIHYCHPFVNNYYYKYELYRTVGNGGLSEECFLVELDDLDQFDMIVDKLENIKGVLKVVRDEKFKSKGD